MPLRGVSLAILTEGMSRCFVDVVVDGREAFAKSSRRRISTVVRSLGKCGSRVDLAGWFVPFDQLAGVAGA
jgi:hypothetical protein